MTMLLNDRVLADSADRDAWLLARREGVTATEIAKIDRGGAAIESLIEEKRTGVQSFTGNRYTEHGKTREPHIARWVQQNFDIPPCGLLFHAEGNRRHLATPDGLGRDFVGNLILSELKTSKKPFTGVPRDYLVQIWWQQYVLGASRTLLVWEQHDDNWPDPQPVDPQPTFHWVERDNAEIAGLIVKADAFLGRLDEAGLPDVSFDLVIDELAQEVLMHRELESLEKRAKESAWSTLQDRLAERGDFTQVSPLARVTRSVIVKSVPETDLEAARAANPELVARYEAITAEYEALLAEHTTQVAKTTTTLTVTKTKKDTDE